MSVVAKILIVINLLLAVAFLAAGATFLGAKTHYKQLFEDEKARAAQEKATLEANLQVARDNLSEQERKASQAGEAQKDAEALLEEKKRSYEQVDKAFQAQKEALVSMTQAQQQLQKDYDAKVERSAELTNQKDEALREKEEAVSRENSAVAEKQKLGDQVLEQNQKLADLAKTIAGLNEKLENTKLELAGYKERVGELGDLIGMKSMDAMVTGVSNKVNLVLLSVGRDDGVKKGYEFTIYRGGEYVGKVVVDRVEKDHCTGYSKKEVERKPIQVGDRGTTRF